MTHEGRERGEEEGEGYRPVAHIWSALQGNIRAKYQAGLGIFGPGTSSVERQFKEFKLVGRCPETHPRLCERPHGENAAGVSPSIHQRISQ